jgi:hypothetical protein
MKKEYIRSTHKFDNETREWIYRGDRGEDKYEEWNAVDVNHRVITKNINSFGVHALKRDQWMDMEWIIDETIRMYIGGASDRTREFRELMDDTPEKEFRDILRKDILEELEYLISIGMVMVREEL